MFVILLFDPRIACIRDFISRRIGLAEIVGDAGAGTLQPGSLKVIDDRFNPLLRYLESLSRSHPDVCSPSCES